MAQKRKQFWQGNLRQIYTFEVPREAAQTKSHIITVILAENKHEQGTCIQEDLYPIIKECNRKGNLVPDPPETKELMRS